MTIYKAKEGLKMAETMIASLSCRAGHPINIKNFRQVMNIVDEGISTVTGTCGRCKDDVEIVFWKEDTIVPSGTVVTQGTIKIRGLKA